MATPLSSFFPLVAPMVPGAPDIAIENAALFAAIEFCQRTLTIQRTLAAVNTVASQAEYTLTQSGEVMVKMLGARLNDQPMRMIAMADLDDSRSLTPMLLPDLIVMSEPMKVLLVPAPVTAGVPIVVRAAMRPAQTATAVDDALFERHAQAIAAGAAGWLLGQPDKTYFNRMAADTAKARMNDAIASEKAAVFFDRARSNPRSRITWC